MTKFRSRAAFKCIVVSLSFWGFTAQRRYRAKSAGTAITVDEDRAIAALPLIPSDLNQQYALQVEPAKHVTALYTCKVHTPRLAATN